MGRKTSKKPNVTAKAAAKVEAVAKAIYQRKKTTTEIIPPDVTRAKVSAWLTLLSPITEWAGLKGDALNYQRRSLRIQQEETLLRVAKSVRDKLGEASISQAVPRKILVPALEKASLEEATDDTMIDRWSSLLASAAQDVKVEPRFVGILEELAAGQAKCLEHVAFNRCDDFDFPAADFDDSFLNFAEYNIRENFENEMSRKLKNGDRNGAFDTLVRTLNCPGVMLAFAVIDCPDGETYTYDAVQQTGIRDDANLAILESLGLIRQVVIKFDLPDYRVNGMYQFAAYYHHLTQLGIDFCNVCSKPRLDELKKIDERSGRNGLKRWLPFVEGRPA